MIMGTLNSVSYTHLDVYKRQSSNIAEGTSRASGKDKAHFSVIAFSSLMETLNQLIIANDLGYLSSEELMELRVKINEIANKLNALRKAQLKA